MSEQIAKWEDISKESEPKKLVKVIPRKDEASKWQLVARITEIYKTPSMHYPDSFQFTLAPKITLQNNNNVMIPFDLTTIIGWKEGDELFADIFNEELKQIVIGKKLSGDDAVKGLDKITAILDEKC